MVSCFFTLKTVMLLIHTPGVAFCFMLAKAVLEIMSSAINEIYNSTMNSLFYTKHFSLTVTRNYERLTERLVG